MQDYQAGKNDGLLMAWDMVKRADLRCPELEKECKFRKMTNISAPVRLKELNDAAAQINHLINESQILLCLSVLHDEFDFGRQRLNHMMDAWEEKNEAFKEDLFLYADYREQIADTMKRVLKTPTLDEEMQDKAKKAGQPYREPVKPEKKIKKMSKKARQKYREEMQRKQRGKTSA
jgi:hypothetical protein